MQIQLEMCSAIVLTTLLYTVVSELSLCKIPSVLCLQLSLVQTNCSTFTCCSHVGPLQSFGLVVEIERAAVIGLRYLQKLRPQLPPIPYKTPATAISQQLCFSLAPHISSKTSATALSQHLCCSLASPIPVPFKTPSTALSAQLCFFSGSTNPFYKTPATALSVQLCFFSGPTNPF